ncbi:MAG: TlpA disulfide reductase family protein [Pseudomonadota bacterium]
MAPVGPYEGYRAPGFVAPMVGGGSLNLASLRGKPVVLVFWASWCAACRSEVPHVNLLAQGVGDSAAIIGVNAGEDPGTAAQAARAMGIGYPVVVDADGAIARRYEARALPLVLVLDPEGRVRLRSNAWPSHINALLDGLAQPGEP